MPLLVALWLALVHALALTPAARPAAWPVVEMGRGTTAEPRVGTGARHPADEALRLAQPVRPVSVARSTTPAVPGPPTAALATPPRLPDAALYAAAVRARALGRSHAISARGDLLPYYPTAPPLRG